MRTYYERRAREYDDWYLGTGRFSDRERPGWDEEVDALLRTLETLPPAHTLDVACGSGFLTRHLSGEVVGLDQSPSMLEVARVQAPHATYVSGDALALPFPDRSFERLFTAHFYGHLDTAGRETFLGEARRVAAELTVLDSALRPEVDPEEWQERILDDGSRWEVFKRYFTLEGLAQELGGGDPVFSGRWFVAVRS
ncbi:MAG: class I SAM-dependent methyltransferase [Gaiellaceae bacterium]